MTITIKCLYCDGIGRVVYLRSDKSASTMTSVRSSRFTVLRCERRGVQRLDEPQDIGSLWRVDWDALGAAFLTDLAEQDS